MSEDAAIRRANLKRLCAGRKWTPADLHAAMGGKGRYTYWRDLLTDPKKSFGEKIARRIEEQLELGRNWLDHDRDGAYPLVANESARPSIASRERESPLSAALTAALRAAEPARLAEIENVLRAMLRLPAADAPAKVKLAEFDFNQPLKPQVNKALKLSPPSPRSKRRPQK